MNICNNFPKSLKFLSLKECSCADVHNCLGMLDRHYNRLFDDGFGGGFGRFDSLMGHLYSPETLVFVVKGFKSDEFAGVIIFDGFTCVSAGFSMCMERKYCHARCVEDIDGFLSEMARALGLKKLKAQVYADNLAPKIGLRRLGFEKEGVLRLETTVNNSPKDISLYAKFFF